MDPLKKQSHPPQPARQDDTGSKPSGGNVRQITGSTGPSTRGAEASPVNRATKPLSSSHITATQDDSYDALAELLINYPGLSSEYMPQIQKLTLSPAKRKEREALVQRFQKKHPSSQQKHSGMQHNERPSKGINLTPDQSAYAQASQPPLLLERPEADTRIQITREELARQQAEYDKHLAEHRNGLAIAIPTATLERTHAFEQCLEALRNTQEKTVSQLEEVRSINHFYHAILRHIQQCPTLATKLDEAIDIIKVTMDHFLEHSMNTFYAQLKASYIENSGCFQPLFETHCKRLVSLYDQLDSNLKKHIEQFTMEKYTQKITEASLCSFLEDFSTYDEFTGETENTTGAKHEALTSIRILKKLITPALETNSATSHKTRKARLLLNTTVNSLQSLMTSKVTFTPQEKNQIQSVLHQAKKLFTLPEERIESTDILAAEKQLCSAIINARIAGQSKVHNTPPTTWNLEEFKTFLHACQDEWFFRANLSFAMQQKIDIALGIEMKKQLAREEAKKKTVPPEQFSREDGIIDFESWKCAMATKQNETLQYLYLPFIDLCSQNEQGKGLLLTQVADSQKDIYKLVEHAHGKSILQSHLAKQLLTVLASVNREARRGTITRFLMDDWDQVNDLLTTIFSYKPHSISITHSGPEGARITLSRRDATPKIISAKALFEKGVPEWSFAPEAILLFGHHRAKPFYKPEALQFYQPKALKYK